MTYTLWRHQVTHRTKGSSWPESISSRTRRSTIRGGVMEVGTNSRGRRIHAPMVGMTIGIRGGNNAWPSRGTWGPSRARRKRRELIVRRIPVMIVGARMGNNGGGRHRRHWRWLGIFRTLSAALSGSYTWVMVVIVVLLGMGVAIRSGRTPAQTRTICACGGTIVVGGGF